MSSNDSGASTAWLPLSSFIVDQVKSNKLVALGIFVVIAIIAVLTYWYVYPKTNESKYWWIGVVVLALICIYFAVATVNGLLV